MPPPPPPPPMRPPNAPDMRNLKLSTGGSDKGALLKDIRQGIQLKKTVTVDKSGPYIPGNTNNNNNNNNKSRSPPSTSTLTTKTANNGGINFDDILAISLRKTGRRPVDDTKIQDALRKQVPPRGPPPQPPAPMFAPTKPVVNENKPVVNRLTTQKLSQLTLQTRDKSPEPEIPLAIPNNSSLHKSHGKPNLAPKPPGVKPAPPPKNGRLPVNRTQSMRVPRSPGASSPQFTLPITEFSNTLRNTSTLHQSNEALNRRNLTPTQRPKQPPPSRPPQTKPPPPPPFRSPVTVPQSPPPPPPPSYPRLAPPPPIHARVAPPPPAHNRALAAPSGGPPPVPPVRGSSMRNGGQVPSSPYQEFDSRFIFHSITEFPLPDVFRGIHKEYVGVPGASGSKQQAPLPPNTTLQLGEKMWPSGDSSTC